MKRLFNNILEFVKYEYKYLLTLLLITVICFFPLKYYIIIGGGISDIKSRVVVNDGYKSEGSFNLSYITETDGYLITYVLSYIIPSWKRVDIDDYKYNKTETSDNINFRNDLSLKKASSDAIKVAYEAASKDIKMVETHYYVITKNIEYTECSALVGDELLELDGHNIIDFNFKDYINSLNEGDYVTLKIIRNKKEKTIKSKVYNQDGNKILGIYIQRYDVYETDPTVNIKFKNSETGPSGGLMTALSIYNQLVKKDITYGLKIAGTGTIDSNGVVGEIGEVEYKLYGAVKGKADVFIVPSGENYNTVMDIVKKDKLKIKVVEADSFSSVLTKLADLSKELK